MCAVALIASSQPSPGGTCLACPGGGYDGRVPAAIAPAHVATGIFENLQKPGVATAGSNEGGKLAFISG